MLCLILFSLNDSWSDFSISFNRNYGNLFFSRENKHWIAMEGIRSLKNKIKYPKQVPERITVITLDLRNRQWSYSKGSDKSILRLLQPEQKYNKLFLKIYPQSLKTLFVSIFLTALKANSDSLPEYSSPSDLKDLKGL